MKMTNGKTNPETVEAVPVESPSSERICHKKCPKMDCIDPDMKPEDCENSCKNGLEDEEVDNDEE